MDLVQELLDIANNGKLSRAERHAVRTAARKVIKLKKMEAVVNVEMGNSMEDMVKHTMELRGWNPDDYGITIVRTPSKGVKRALGLE